MFLLHGVNLTTTLYLRKTDMPWMSSQVKCICFTNSTLRLQNRKLQKYPMHKKYNTPVSYYWCKPMICKAYLSGYGAIYVICRYLTIQFVVYKVSFLLFSRIIIRVAIFCILWKLSFKNIVNLGLLHFRICFSFGPIGLLLFGLCLSFGSRFIAVWYLLQFWYPGLLHFGICFSFGSRLIVLWYLL